MSARILWITALLFVATIVAAVLYYNYMVPTPINVPLNTDVKKQGVIVLAHGGNAHWNNTVREAALPLARRYPTRVVFGMADAMKIQAAVHDIEAQNVKRIVVVPLYVSSYSELFRQTEYVLGFRAEPDADFSEGMKRAMRNPVAFLWKKVSWDNIPYAIEMLMSHGFGSHQADMQVTTRKPLVLLPALDQSELVAEILAERALAQSTDPAQESVIVIAHGPIRDDDDKRWLAAMDILAEKTREKGFHRVCVATIRDDAAADIKGKAIEHVRALVYECMESTTRVLVVPLLLSRGGIEKEIHHILEGLSYTYEEQTLLPHQNITEWLLRSAETARSISVQFPLSRAHEHHE